jgi:hypothetical protein
LCLTVAIETYDGRNGLLRVRQPSGRRPPLPYGDVRAVNELCLNNDWEFAYLALGNFGYMDVALCRLKKRLMSSLMRMICKPT